MSNSKFNLIETVEGLDTLNDGVSECDYMQVTSLADIAGANFVRSQIVYNWETAGNIWTSPSESFFRFRMSFQTAAGVQLDANSDIAPSMNCCAGLFSTIQLEMNDRVVSRLDNYVQQVDSVATRIFKNKAVIESSNGIDVYSPAFEKRMGIICKPTHVVGAASTVAQNSLGCGSMYRLVSGDWVKVSTDTLAISATTPVVATIAEATAGPPVNMIRGAFIKPGDIFEYVSSAGAIYRNTVNLVEVIDGKETKITLDTNGPPFTVALPAAAASTGWQVRIYSPFFSQDFPRAAKDIELLWQPPISFFNVKHYLPPNARYRLTLTPNQNYKVACVESVVDKKVGTDYDVLVNQANLYIRTYRGDSYDAGNFLLDLTSINVQSELVPSNNLTQKNFDVSPSTTHLIVAYQQSSAGSDTKYSASKFIMDPRNIDVNMDVTRFFLNFAGKNYPQPDLDATFVDGKDYYTWAYMQAVIGGGMYPDVGGTETYEQWKQKGPLFIYAVNRDGRSQATRVQVNQSFVSALATRNLLLMNVFKQVCKVSIANAKVQMVELSDR